MLPDESELNLKYIQGLTFKDGAERVYQDLDKKVQVNVWTPRKKEVWGYGERSYSIIGTKKFYDTYEDLCQAVKEQSE